MNNPGTLETVDTPDIGLGQSRHHGHHLIYFKCKTYNNKIKTIKKMRNTDPPHIS